MGHRWGHCITDSACLAYTSAITFKKSVGGGPCTTCGQYPAGHIHLGRYPIRCSVSGCPCSEFHPENDPESAVLEGVYHEAHNNLVCGVCGHSTDDHCDPFNSWDVPFRNIDVLEKVGEGSHRRVHRCRLAGHTKFYALQVLKSDTWSAQTLSNFLREMSILSTLRHPNIMALVAGCMDTKAARRGTGSLAIVTDLAVNGNLQEVLMRQPTEVTIPRWLQMVSDIARGLEYLHSQRIIHRKLKPQNCMVDGSWRIRVSDFGLSGNIAKDNNDNDLHDMDLIAPVNGTMAAFMSPELLQLHGAKKRSLASARKLESLAAPTLLSTAELSAIQLHKAAGQDIWALGVLLWTIQHRSRPFADWKTEDVVVHVRSTSLNGELPLAIAEPPPPFGREDLRLPEQRHTFCSAQSAALLKL